MQHSLNMKALLTTGIVSVALMSSVAIAPAGATLIDRGNGLIYDNDLNITWLQDANLAATNQFGLTGGEISSTGRMGRFTANDWITGMNAANYKGFNDWRLPTTKQPDATCSDQLGDQTSGFGCTGSEMGHLFNIEGVTHATPGLFENVQVPFYWSDTTPYAFTFFHGGQFTDSSSDPNGAWAVRSGDVSAVPEPSTIFLLGSGLVGLIGYRMKKARAYAKYGHFVRN